jgi:fibronectin-binding autotransporter adhesin
MRVVNSIGRKASTPSQISTAKKRSAVILTAAVSLGSMAGLHSAHADLLIWTNAGANGSWDGVSANWNDTTSLANPTTYADSTGGNPTAVQFSGSGPGGTISVQNVTGTPAGVTPGSVEFTAGVDGYTFTDGAGTGGIQGAGPLALDAGYTGTVYLSGQDSLSGIATVSGGTLQLTGSAGSTLGTANIVLNGGNLAFQHSLTAMANNIMANQTTSGLVSNAAGDNITFVGTLSSTAGATTSNTVLNFSGGSTDTEAPLTATNVWGGFVGTLNWGATAQVLRLEALASGDTLGSSTALFNLGTSTGTLEMENATGVVLVGGLSGASTTTLAGATHSGVNTNNQGEFVIGGAGLNTVYNGLITQGAERNWIEVTGNGSLTLSNGANTYAAKTGVSTTVLGNGQEPYAGVISAFLTSNASNGGGQLYVSNATGSATGTGPVYVEGASSATNTGNGITGGLLGGDGIITSLVSTIATAPGVAAADSAPILTGFAAGAIIDPSQAGGNTSEKLTLSGGLTLGDFANLDFSLDTLPGTLADAQISMGSAGVLTLPADDNIAVNFSFPNGDPELNVPYTLIGYTAADVNGGSGVANFVPKGVPAGDTVSFNDASGAITATFVAVPEPTSLGLLGVGVLGLLRRRRARM